MPSEPELTVRPATLDDADRLSSLFLRAREAAYPAIPRPLHPADDVRRWMRTRVTAPDCEAWLAEEKTRLVGLMLLEDSWVQSLYVDPDRTGRGIGSVLLEVAKSRRPRRLGLWVFESNEGARRFYLRHGFGEVRRTDGSDNEERAPDIEMAWPDPGSLQALRARIDDIDDRLARLLEERASLTARVQQVKPVSGHAGRDPAREAQIVRRMARLAPMLGEDRLGRIMQAVITEGLDVAEQGGPSEENRTPGRDP
jgi:chorismate mutase/GNAT superfamily N-acetyltransferase